MTHTKQSKEDLELNELLAEEQELCRRMREFEENQRRIVREREESNSMIPPLADIQDRESMRLHGVAVSRGEVKNQRRVVERSFMLLLLLTAATCALLWWGWKVMHGS